MTPRTFCVFAILLGTTTACSPGEVRVPVPTEAAEERRPARPPRVVDSDEPLDREILLEILQSAPPAPNPPGPERPAGQPSRAPTRGTVGFDLRLGEVAREPRLDLAAIEQVVTLPSREGRFAAEQGGMVLEGAELGLEDSGAATTRASDRELIEETYIQPWRTIVKLVMQFTGGDGQTYYYVCTGFTADSYHVLTAGHCLYNHDPDDDDDQSDASWTTAVWAFAGQTDQVDVIGVPDWPYGEAHGTYARTFDDWTDSQDHDHDWAVLTLDRRLGDLVGWMAASSSEPTSVNIAGYPADCPDAACCWDGKLQYHSFDSGNVTGITDYSIDVDAYLFGGDSGGPYWTYDANTGERYVRAIHSHGPSGCDVGGTGTRLTSNKFAYFNQWVSDDDAARPPTDRADLVEYLLATDAKSLLTTSAKQGDTFDVEFNVGNVGYINSGTIDVDFYLSSNTLVTDYYDNYVGTVTLSGLDAWSMTNPTATLTVPADLAPGDYYVGWIMSCAESEYSTTNHYLTAYGYESYDDNMAVIADATLTVEEATFDLEVTDVDVSNGVYEPGDQIEVEWDLRNNGTSDIESYGFTIRLSTNTTITLYDEAVCSGLILSGPGAGETLSDSITCNIPEVADGDYYVGLILDDDDDLDETDESNNTGYDPATVEVNTPSNCVSGGTLSCSSSTDSRSNDSAGSTDDVTEYGCYGGYSYSGPEFAYTFVADESGEVTLTLSGLNDDLDLFLLDGSDCDPSACLAGSANGGTDDESITYDVTAGAEYRIVVDGYAGAVSDYTLELNCGAEGTFADGFESGGFEAWSVARVGGGDLSVRANAALEGSQGLRVLIDDTAPKFVADGTPEGATSYAASFLIDPHSLSLGYGDGFAVLAADEAGATRWLWLELQRGMGPNPGYVRVAVLVRTDSGGVQYAGSFPIPAHQTSTIDVEWTAATADGANDGRVLAWRDGVLRVSLDDCDNDQAGIDTVFFGPSRGVDATTQGVFFLDGFESTFGS